MNPTLPREFLPDVLAQSIQDPRSRTLYELCFLHRDHLRDEVVADKLRLIGRLYAAPGAGLGFSPEFSAHRLTQSAVDQWFGSLATAEALDVGLLLELHKRVMNVFDDMPLPLARSLASKYLHFHFPELFCIYDEQVETAAANLMEGSCGFLAISDFDPVYGRFHACCRKLAKHLAPAVGHRLSPPEMDRLLRAWLAYQEAVQSPPGLLSNAPTCGTLESCYTHGSLEKRGSTGSPRTELVDLLDTVRTELVEVQGSSSCHHLAV